MRSHIISYLKTLYGPEEPISFPKKSDYNAFLVKKLGLPPRDFRLDCSNMKKIAIQPPETNLKDLFANNYLGFHDQIAFRRIVERDFISDFHAFVNQKITEGWNRKMGTIMFMELNNIVDDELSYSAFYRDFNRLLFKRRSTFSKSEY